MDKETELAEIMKLFRNLFTNPPPEFVEHTEALFHVMERAGISDEGQMLLSMVFGFYLSRRDLPRVPHPSLRGYPLGANEPLPRPGGP